MKTFVAVLVFASVLSTGLALKCFKCNSINDKMCDDGFDGESETLKNSFLKECELPANMNSSTVYCKKVKMWFNNEVRVHRSCGLEKREYPEPCFQSRADDHIVDTCQCDADNCNPATTFFPSLLAVVGAAVAALRV